jgi:ectoine hydroxylase-related dioxygenase (phytanoyl-CoA dioxygenase family)
MLKTKLDIRSAINENGFMLIQELFPHSAVSQLLEALNHSQLKRSRAGARHILSHPGVNSLAVDSRLLNIAQDVLGPAAFPFRATLFDKTATANWLVVWHQDTALPLRERHETTGWGPWSIKDGVHYAHAPASALSQVLALRFHLDQSNADNGPLRILPGTHKLGVLTDDAVHDLASNASPVDCHVSAGGVLAMFPLLIHASSKSQVPLPRRVIHIEYAASPSIAAPLELAPA